LFAAALAVLLASAVTAQNSEIQNPNSVTSTSVTGTDAPTGLFTEIVQVRVINVDVFVTDRSGQSVAGLSRDDFELRVDGRSVPISNFYSEMGGTQWTTSKSTELLADSTFRSVEEVQADPAHRTHVVILIDHTRLHANNRKRTLAALREAIEGLGPEDLVAVVGLEGSLIFYSDFLYDRQALDRLLDKMSRVSVQSSGIGELERRRIFGDLAHGQSGGILGRTSDTNSDAVMSRIRAYAAQEFARSRVSLREIERVVTTLAGVQGRKAVLYVGEGIPTRPGEGLFVEWRNRFGGGDAYTEFGIRRVDFNTDYTRAVGRFDLTTAINRLAASANHAGVTLYSVDAEGDHGGEIRSALTVQGATSEAISVIDENFRAPLESASKATGGRMLRSSGKLLEQLDVLMRDFDTFYSLGFNAGPDWQPGSEHKISVKTKGKGLRVRYRKEVRLPKPDEREASATVAALIYQTINNPLELRATPSARIPREDGTVTVPVILEVPVKNLGFIPQGDNQAASLTFYVSIKNEDGDAGRVQKIPFHVAIPEAHMEAALADSVHYPLPLVLRPGDQQAAIGIRDNVNGTFSAVRIDVSEFSQF
ncbi:MAG: VWA domain-containing protein, partial [Thermoanaerobaculia bacterium]